MNKTTTAGIPGIAGAIAEIEKRNDARVRSMDAKKIIQELLNTDNSPNASEKYGARLDARRFLKLTEGLPGRLIAKAPELFAQIKDYVENADCGNGGEHTGEYGDKAEDCWHCKATKLIHEIEEHVQ